MTIFLSAKDIFFTQCSVADTFTDGITIKERLQELLDGLVKSKVPMMTVTFQYGKYWTLNNRRLLVFKKLDRRGMCGWLKVNVLPFHEVDDKLWNRKFTTKNEGTFVTVRTTQQQDYSSDESEISNDESEMSSCFSSSLQIDDCDEDSDVCDYCGEHEDWCYC